MVNSVPLAETVALGVFTSNFSFAWPGAGPATFAHSEPAATCTRLAGVVPSFLVQILVWVLGRICNRELVGRFTSALPSTPVLTSEALGRFIPWVAFPLRPLG